MKHQVTWDWEYRLEEQGYQVIAGIDEVGRGCWAGPLVAVAYVFHTIPTDILVGDSKTIRETERLRLAEELKQTGFAGIGEVSPQEIDTLGLQAAQYVAYNRALSALPHFPDAVLLDGRPWYTCPVKHEAIVGGDGKVASIAAASIAAKVHRDRHMQTVVHARYPDYGFDVHVGYGTKKHQEALRLHGVVDIHRKSYKPIKSLLALE